MSRGGLIVAALVTSCAAEHKTVHFVRHGEALHNPKAEADLVLLGIGIPSGGQARCWLLVPRIH